MTDTAATTAQPEADALMTGQEYHERIKALSARIEKTASKTTLVLYLATRTVVENGFFQNRNQALDEAEAKLLAELKSWTENGRLVNANRRRATLIRKLDENTAAIEAGRRPPHKFKAPKRRKARRAKA